MMILKNGPGENCDLDHSKAGCLWHLCEKTCFGISTDVLKDGACSMV
ncbi:hypothetical protein B4098_2696 [Heyndrickxia coagulans]|uniref:Uncharacterized protein n=1 Tax=Heyndrickxia coagulans TaxID=1398 RepID=A0A150KJX0_HEYCO|nr:hypothetical protein B4098_2696 [Heyndrickxia coagulans]KYC73865.1 hypothetical protein B4099_2826 [Heyndrickxia coagulans]